MGIVLDSLKLEMMDCKECMSDCKEYRKFNSTGKLTSKCQGCPHYAAVFKKVIQKMRDGSISSTL